ncbi:MAG TPA: hypothetical protein VJ826_13260 [Candidatus Polarisedimenticolaceae bacterium]|nr:hypothetical protein [Candidatus Polarisedimenticolaceae bacterium]
MICPVCRDEYRKGFTRCATCSVDLVETLDVAAPAVPSHRPAATTSHAPAGKALAVELTERYCGFVSLEEARAARGSLSARSVRSLIVIEESPEGEEEYWLRISPDDAKAAIAILGRHEVPPTPDESFNCSACGVTVGPSDRACPGCGLEFAE